MAPLTHTPSYSLFLLAIHPTTKTLTSTSVGSTPYTQMFSLGVYLPIHNIGLFTNIALNGTLTLFADIALSRLRPIRLLSESTWI